MERNAYIQNNDLQTSKDLFLSELGEYKSLSETVKSEFSLGRVTAKAVFAKKCDPSYNAAAMDGIAVVAEGTHAASEATPLNLIENKDFVYINTGNALTGKFNAVIMIEDVLRMQDGTVSVIAPAYPWQHVRVIGESIVVGETVITSKHKITPCDIGALIASGNIEVEVYKKPAVGIIPTGEEMIDDPDKLTAGKLMESNSKVFAALTVEYGGNPKRYPVVSDDIEKLKEAVKKAVSENDIVIVNAGSSAGTKDFTVKAIAEMGKVVVHGVAIKPGKPTILGIIDGKPIIGIPGYPVSAYLVFDLFVKPLITLMLGESCDEDETVTATLTRRVTGSMKYMELIRVALGYVGGKLVATPRERGAGAVMSLVNADGIMRLPRLTEGIEAGSSVQVQLIKPLTDIKRALVIIGSHDMIIDVIRDKTPISSAHVGSMGGIFSMLNGECHLAPIHLLDEESGVYNIPYVKKYFPNKKMALIKCVGRQQGLLVPKGNPKDISDVADVKKYNLSYANRQTGAGTRILFDYRLKQLNIDPSEINGYEKQYSTHLAVAVAIKNGVSDTGMAVKSAANALGLDFVPIAEEEYDFLLPYDELSDERVQNFIKIIKSDGFKSKLDEFGGYSYDKIGEIVVIE